jgi:predicted DNA-binding transcriptional regulator AlpA
MSAGAQTMERPFLTTVELASRYGVSLMTIRDWRKKGTGPVATKLGGLVRYALADVLAWERSRRDDQITTGA